jgi:hypothetical protein
LIDFDRQAEIGTHGPRSNAESTGASEEINDGNHSAALW